MADGDSIITLVVPSDKQPQNDSSHEKPSILVISGSQQGTEIAITETPFIIGSNDSCNFKVKDPAVSRKHCEIDFDGLLFTLRDNNSTNGTFISGLRIGTAYLTSGTEITIGSTKLIFTPGKPQNSNTPLSSNNHFGDAIGSSPQMRRIFHMLENYSPTDASIMLTGETGTGKEIIAEEIHKHSHRADKPYIIIDCTSISKDLVESELFGHMKGSFTGAFSDRAGAFEAANGGTVFLDEIGELPQELQPKLLRVLEKREIKRIGSNIPIKIDVRIICATNRNLQNEIRNNNFREDLFYRLSVVNVELPPLRNRVEDIPELVKSFMMKLHNADATKEILDFDFAMNALTKYDWPGNIRELRNLVDRAFYRIEKPVDIVSCLYDASLMKQNTEQNIIDSTKPFKEEKNRLIDDFERKYIEDLLNRNNFNVSRSAREAGIERAYLQRLIKKYNLSINQ